MILIGVQKTTGAVMNECALRRRHLAVLIYHLLKSKPIKTPIVVQLPNLYASALMYGMPVRRYARSLN